MKPSRKKRFGALFAAALIALSAAAFNPAAVTAAAAPITAYYTEIADIPDFGAFAGVGLYDKTEEDFDSYKVIAYLYTDGVDGAKVSAYVDAVVAAGYELKNESVTKGGNLVHTYAKGTKGVMLVAAPGRFMVGLIDLEAVARYDRFPDIPDFEPYVADVLVSKKVEGDARLTVYTYHCNGDGVGNTMMEYGKYLVQGFGWEYKGLYLEGPTGYAFEKDHMSMVLSCPTATGLDS
ncbi:MAG: hypothetical protein LBR83_05595, partial [Clostridiales bacterium]|nr:hypothetical protein [Clostridiales bacterium]